MAQVDDTEADYEIVLSNVVCTVNLGCHLNLQKLAEKTFNVELRNSRLAIKLRKPKVTAYIWSKGKIMCLGAQSEEDARLGLRRVARIVQKKGFDVKLRKMCIVNVNACCILPFRIRMSNFVTRYHEASYEPELYPAAIYKIPDLKASLSIFATGNISIIAPTVANIYKAAEYIYPRVEEFRRELTAADEVARAEKRMLAQRRLLFR